jgi:FAD/FMN-containing dehydrogenase
MPPRLTFSRRRNWRNHTGNQGVDPLRVYEPESLEKLRDVVLDAQAAGTTVRAVGSGHSWSDVAIAPGFLVKPGKLNGACDLERQLLRPREASEPSLVRVESGMLIRDLNALLDEQSPALALPNMGGYDGQTIAGVISTSTHGSGTGFGPLSDLVVSLDVVAGDGTLYRIEPGDGGPTDPEAFSAHRPAVELKQDDDWFRAALVGMGCLGLIHSVILAVGPAHYLREVRCLSTWAKERGEIESGRAFADNDHYELLFSPYPREDGEIECLVTTRNRIEPDEYRHDRRRSRNWLLELLIRTKLPAYAANFLTGIWPKLSPFMLHLTMAGIVNPDYVNKSFRVLNIGAANYLPAYSSEIGVPVDARGLHFQAVDAIVEVAARHRELGQTYHSAPIALRFVKASNAFMSMMHGRTTMTIELIMQTHTKGGIELLAAHEDRLFALDGRPHWGQLNWITRDRVSTLYPEFERWLAVRAQLDSTGVFSSPFSKRVGISSAGSS